MSTNQHRQATGHALEMATIQVTPVSIPAAVYLFASGLGLLGFIRRKRAAS